MNNLDWLLQREAKIVARISEEHSPTGRESGRPSDRQARRDALMVIRRRIAELEAREDNATPTLSRPQIVNGR
jgi:hypothetical protein